MKQTPKGILKRWCDGINKKRLGDLLRLYNNEAELLPTFSNRRLNSSDEIKKYFERLLACKKLSVDVHDRTVCVLKTSDTVCVVSGIYLWKIEMEKELLHFEARFTMVVDVRLSAPVLHHHSSQIPRML